MRGSAVNVSTVQRAGRGARHTLTKLREAAATGHHGHVLTTARTAGEAHHWKLAALDEIIDGAVDLCIVPVSHCHHALPFISVCGVVCRIRRTCQLVCKRIGLFTCTSRRCSCEDESTLSHELQCSLVVSYLSVTGAAAAAAATVVADSVVAAAAAPPAGPTMAGGHRPTTSRWDSMTCLLMEREVGTRKGMGLAIKLAASGSS